MTDTARNEEGCPVRYPEALASRSLMMRLLQISAPLVFQCENCGAIVADSFAWVASDEKLNAITLSGPILWSELCHLLMPPLHLFSSCIQRGNAFKCSGDVDAG